MQTKYCSLNCIPKLEFASFLNVTNENAMKETDSAQWLKVEGKYSFVLDLPIISMSSVK